MPVTVEDQVPHMFEVDTIDQPYAIAEPFLRTTPEVPSDISTEAVRFAWLEITGNCQEECGHCYAGSGPEGTNGTMTTGDWKRIIDQLAEAGTEEVQFIGGEPTLHPDLNELISHSLDRGLGVEVFSNMVHITSEHWKTFQKPGVQLATSYYSKDPAVHREITKANTHNPIRRNIRKATELGIPLRIGVIGVLEGQDIEGAVAELLELGVDKNRIGIDYMRQVGRGIRDEVAPDTTSQLCGNCANGVAAVLPDGRVQPCVFSRQSEFTIGNVQEGSVSEIFESEQFATVRGLLRSVFEARPEMTGCEPGIILCEPENKPECPPQIDNPDDFTVHALSNYITAGCRPTCQPNCNPSTTGGEPCAPDKTCPPLTLPPTPPTPPTPPPNRNLVSVYEQV